MIVDLGGNPDTTPLTFGKYKGLQPKYVADRDPRYIVWLREQHDHGDILVSNELYERCRTGIEEGDEVEEDQEAEGVKDVFNFMTRLD